MKFFTILLLFVIVVAARVVGFRCNPAVLLVKNDCNTCTCLDGDLSHINCTPGVCHEKESTELKNCKKIRIWKNVCNYCWCLPGQGTFCEAKRCRRRGPLILPILAN